MPLYTSNYLAEKFRYHSFHIPILNSALSSAEFQCKASMSIDKSNCLCLSKQQSTFLPVSLCCL